MFHNVYFVLIAFSPSSCENHAKEIRRNYLGTACLVTCIFHTFFSMLIWSRFFAVKRFWFWNFKPPPPYAFQFVAQYFCIILGVASDSYTIPPYYVQHPTQLYRYQIRFTFGKLCSMSYCEVHIIYNFSTISIPIAVKRCNIIDTTTVRLFLISCTTWPYNYSCYVRGA